MYHPYNVIMPLKLYTKLSYFVFVTRPVHRLHYPLIAKDVSFVLVRIYVCVAHESDVRICGIVLYEILLSALKLTWSQSGLPARKV